MSASKEYLCFDVVSVKITSHGIEALTLDTRITEQQARVLLNEIGVQFNWDINIDE